MIEKKEIELGVDDEFICPICGKMLFRTNSDGVIALDASGKFNTADACKHLAFIVLSGMESMLFYSSASYSSRLVTKLFSADADFTDELLEDTIKKLSGDDIRKLINNDYSVNDELTYDLGEIINAFKYLLSDNSVIYEYVLIYESLRIAIEP